MTCTVSSARVLESVRFWRKRSRCVTRLALAVLLASEGAWGEPDPARLAKAKEAFRTGVALLESGDTERALEQFLRSRELVPSGKNTANAAICLERLKRYDEALELYEELLSSFASDLNEEDRPNLAPVMAALRRQIGYIDLSANVDGLVTVAGRPRGRLPFRTALRVLPGRQTLRIVKDGYKTFETIVEVRAAETQNVDAELTPLATLGALRIESSNRSQLDLFVDGVRMGVTPWEGTLRAGTHVVVAQRGDQGSVPQSIRVLEGRTELLRLPARRLGPTLEIMAEPATATIRLGSIQLGSGQYRGRLPVGRYSISLGESGYFARELSLEVDSVEPKRISVRLQRDPSHPRWPRPRAWFLQLGAEVGPSFAPRTGAGLESSCPSQCAGSRAAWGALGALRVGARHEAGLGFMLLGGYRYEHQQLARAVSADLDTAPVTYALEQTTDARGPYLALQAEFSRPVLGKFEIGTRAGGGVWAASAGTELAGVAFSEGPATAIRASSVPGVSWLAPFMVLGVGAERRFGRLRIHAYLEGHFFPVAGPTFDGPVMGVGGPCPSTAASGDVRCSPNTRAISGESSHGRFFSLSPTFGASLGF